MATNDENSAVELYVEEQLVASYPSGVTDLASPLQQVLAARTEAEWTARLQAVVTAAEGKRA